MNMKNERHYGWGNEYYDCYNRFTNLGNNVYRFDAPLFHLCHPRKENSSFRPKHFTIYFPMNYLEYQIAQIRATELHKII